MDYLSIGAGGALKASSVAFGTLTFGPQVGRLQADQLIGLCRDHGVNYFDTANSYDNGRAEAILGDVVKGFRGEILLSSKVFYPHGNEESPMHRGLSQGAIELALTATLRRLKTDYLDVYFAHAPDHSVALDETISTFDDLVRQGKIREYGLSNYSAWESQLVNCIGERSSLRTPSVYQMLYNLIARDLDFEFISMAASVRVPIYAFNPLAGGLLSGRYRFEDQPRSGRFVTQGRYKQRYWTDRHFEAVGRLLRLAEKVDVSLVELSLRWLRSKMGISGVMLGASSLAQLRQNLESWKQGELEAAVLDECDLIWEELRGPFPTYFR